MISLGGRVCVCVLCLRACMHLFVCSCMHAYIRACVYMCVYVCMYVCMYCMPFIFVDMHLKTILVVSLFSFIL